MFHSILTANCHSPLKYETLSPTHHDSHYNTHKKRNHSFLKISFYIVLVFCSILQITLTFYAVSILKAFPAQPPNIIQNPTHRVSNCSCGATIQEAKTLDCTFDVLSLSWLPPHCRDDALTHEFATSGPGSDGEWDYWAHVNGTSPLKLDEVAALAERTDGYVYTSFGFHVLHCSFYWRKQWRVAKGVGALAMEARYDRESHVKHCQRMFMMEGSREEGVTKGLVRLGGEFFS